MSINGRKVLRGFMANVSMLPPLVLSFQFNPASIQDNKGARYNDGDAEAGGVSPGKDYHSGGHRTISFDLKLHGNEVGMNLPLTLLNKLDEGSAMSHVAAIDNGVSTELAKLRSFMYPREDAFFAFGVLSADGATATSPPTVLFGYGTKILECRMTGLRINETQFNTALAPTRADARVDLTVIEEADQALFSYDRIHRNILAAIGLANVRLWK